VPSAPLDLRAARRQLLLDTFGIGVSVGAFGLVFGLAARGAGYSIVEAVAMSTIGFAGAAQFAVVGFVVTGAPWAAIALLTFLLNARHLLYSASLAPHLRRLPPSRRAVMAHFLTDEAFALSATHFHRLGRVDVPGYWIAALLGVFVPWNLCTLAGFALGGAIPDPSRYGLDIVFPAAMGGLGIGLVTGRRELIAAGAGAAIAVCVWVIADLGLGVSADRSLGVVVGGLLGPLVGLAFPDRGRRVTPDSDVTGAPVDLARAMSDVEGLDDAGSGA
jgi:4-azaleucine resistance transporter AzlC